MCSVAIGEATVRNDRHALESKVVHEYAIVNSTRITYKYLYRIAIFFMQLIQQPQLGTVYRLQYSVRRLRYWLW